MASPLGDRGLSPQCRDRGMGLSRGDSGDRDGVTTGDRGLSPQCGDRDSDGVTTGDPGLSPQCGDRDTVGTMMVPAQGTQDCHLNGGTGDCHPNTGTRMQWGQRQHHHGGPGIVTSTRGQGHSADNDSISMGDMGLSPQLRCRDRDMVGTGTVLLWGTGDCHLNKGTGTQWGL
uniref:Uncharacterized protein n=1 Tax=Columba livia TaxID=8932 RepID=R7VY34_COLLI